MEGLAKVDPSSKESLQKALLVEDYSDNEIKLDKTSIDFDFALGEVMKFENLKQQKAEAEHKEQLDKMKDHFEQQIKNKFL
jgi:hypothetical protein